jgi:hypothetical protein
VTFASNYEGRNDQAANAERDRDIGEVERGPMYAQPVEVEEVHDLTV